MVTFVIKFTVHGDTAEFERVFFSHAAFMRQQPGFIDHHVVRSQRRPQVYLNVARWTDADAHQAAMRHAESRQLMTELAGKVDVEADLCITVEPVDATN